MAVQYPPKSAHQCSSVTRSITRLISIRRAFIDNIVRLHVHVYVITFSFTLWLHRSNAEESYHLTKVQQNGNSTTTESSGRPDLGLYLGVYGGFVIGLFLLCLFSTELFYSLTIVASRNLYDKMLSSLMRAPMYFFDNNSIGEKI